MQALIRGLDGPEKVDLPLGDPAPGEVLVAVDLVGVCRTDIHAAYGRISVPYGRVLGHEGVGTVMAVQGGGAFRIGERVALLPWMTCGQCVECSSGRGSRCRAGRFLGLDRDGAFAEQILVPESALLSLPDDLDDRLSAFLEPVAAAMAVLEPLRQVEGNIAIVGRGRVARLVAILIEEELGHPVRMVDRAQETEEFEAAKVIECEGSSASLALATSIVAPGGTILLKSRPASSPELPLGALVRKEVSLVCVNYGGFSDALSWLRNKGALVETLLGDEYALDQFLEAFAANAAEDRKVFLRPGID